MDSGAAKLNYPLRRQHSYCRIPGRGNITGVNPAADIHIVAEARWIRGVRDGAGEIANLGDVSGIGPAGLRHIAKQHVHMRRDITGGTSVIRHPSKSDQQMRSIRHVGAVYGSGISTRNGGTTGHSLRPPAGGGRRRDDSGAR